MLVVHGVQVRCLCVSSWLLLVVCVAFLVSLCLHMSVLHVFLARAAHWFAYVSLGCAVQ